jgi:hypothetical protein
MPEIKTSTVEEVGAIRSWDGPNGTVYYHHLLMANGDKGSIGKKTEGAFKIGDSLTYTIELNDKGNKIKEYRENSGGYNSNAGGQQSRGGAGSCASFATAYSKDVYVAMISAGLVKPTSTADAADAIIALAHRLRADMEAAQ